MIKLNRRGFVLVHVLITGVIVAVIAAELLRMVLMNYIAIDRAAKGTQNRKEAESMLNRAIGFWNETNSVCSTNAGFTCAGPGVGTNTCNCSCPNGSALPRIVVTKIPSGVGGPPPCAITIISSDPQ